MFSSPLAEIRRTSRVPAGIFADDEKKGEGIKVEMKSLDPPLLLGSRSFSDDLGSSKQLFVRLYIEIMVETIRRDEPSRTGSAIKADEPSRTVLRH